MSIGFDVISDLNLSPNDVFEWEGKASSLYCIIAGNVSDDLATIRRTLQNLSKYYQGVFYALGALEYKTATNIDLRTEEIFRMTKGVRNVALLHYHVVIIDGVAVVGVNGWYGNPTHTDTEIEKQIQQSHQDDVVYLKSTIDRLQKHLDVKNVITVSNSVPGPTQYFGEIPEVVDLQIPLTVTLAFDTENKVSHWVYGTYNKEVDTVISGVNYINNGCFNKKPYWSKRITIEV